MRSDLAIKAALVVVGVALAVYITRRASTAVVDTAQQALQAVNPWNQDNVIYQTANQAVQAATGTPDTLGTWLYNVLHPNEQDINGAFFTTPRDPYDVRLYRAPPDVTPTTPGGALQNDAGYNFAFF